MFITSCHTFKSFIIIIHMIVKGSSSSSLKKKKTISSTPSKEILRPRKTRLRKRTIVSFMARRVIRTKNALTT